MSPEDREPIKLTLRTSTVATLLEILEELDHKFQSKARNSRTQKGKHTAQALKFLVMKREIESQLTPGRSNGSDPLISRALGELSKPLTQQGVPK